MRVHIRLFAGIRELMGGDIDAEFEGSEVSLAAFRAHLAKEHPALEPYLPVLAVAINQEYVTDSTTLIREGDEVALIQPISGGAPDADPSGSAAGGSVPYYRLSSEPLDPRALRDLVRTDASGAVVLFEGTVRNHHEGRAVERLEYEAYDAMVERQLARVGEEVRRDFPEVHGIAIHHRAGMLAVGDAAVLVAVSAAHRHAAFAAAERAMDRVKETVPVWKREWGPDGAMWQEGAAPVPGETERAP